MSKEKPMDIGDSEAEKTWEETLVSYQAKIEGEFIGADSEVARLKRYVEELMEMLEEGTLKPIAKEIDESGLIMAFLERVTQQGISDAVLYDFNEGWDFINFVSSKRKRIQVFHERVTEKLKVMKKEEENEVEHYSLDNFKQSGAQEQLATLESIRKTISKEREEKFKNQLNRELSILERIHNEMYPPAEEQTEESFDAIDEQSLEAKLEEAEAKIAELEGISADRLRIITELTNKAKKAIIRLRSKIANEGRVTLKHSEELDDLNEKIRELEEDLVKAKKELEEAINNVDRARQTSFSSAPPPPDSPDGRLVTENQELKKEVEDLKRKIIESDIENSNFPHQIELLESEVERLEEHIAEGEKLPAPSIDALTDAIKEKEELKAKNEANLVRIDQLENEAVMTDIGNADLRSRFIKLEKKNIKLTQQLEAKTSPPHPRLPKKLPKPTGSPVPPPKRVKPTQAQEPRVVLSPEFIDDIKNVEKSRRFGFVRGLVSALFTEVD